ncbi:MAG TPA: hypothetical protein VFE60_20140, partial [Roseiarcus sp.]|nr:hypothetical protein [Roseiarcus sp.]
WAPRDYQMNVWRYLERGGKRAICVWHRRAGKDDVCLHWAAASMIDKPATYWHMLPAFSQGRKAIWTAVAIVPTCGEIRQSTVAQRRPESTFSGHCSWRLEVSERKLSDGRGASSRLVLTHQAGVADDIGNQDRCEFAGLGHSSGIPALRRP